MRYAVMPLADQQEASSTFSTPPQNYREGVLLLYEYMQFNYAVVLLTILLTG
jgi:hypothetical protein